MNWREELERRLLNQGPRKIIAAVFVSKPPTQWRWKAEGIPHGADEADAALLRTKLICAAEEFLRKAELESVLITVHGERGTMED